jgi:quercetin dioxygenase-like cupin family protein
MIRQKGEFTSKTVNNVRGGQGDIVRTEIFFPEELLEKANACVTLTIPHGSTIGEHAHGPDAELYYILSGTLRVTDSGVTKDLTAGDVVFTGGGTFHGVENVSGEDASLFAFVVK